MRKLTEAKEKALQRVFEIIRKEEICDDDIERELLLENQIPYQYEEGFIKEDLNKFYSKTRKVYRSGKRYTFKEWISVMMEIMDELN
tara:strand:- start:221 stop:481 length:261 start_codon:yes stop_codon:yes gene_type:complete